MVNASFALLNDGMPQVPTGGGYRPGPQLPIMRAPAAEIVPAGYGPIVSGMQGFMRSLFTSPPPMGGRSYEAGVEAIMSSNPNFWR